MIEPPDDARRAPITPQLALRAAVLGGLALVLFGVVFFRLWFLQILSGSQYVARADDNQVRSVRIQAPRGAIVDRSGRMLVGNRQATVIQVQPTRLPASAAARDREFRSLGRVLNMSAGRIRRLIRDQTAALPYANATIKADATPAVVGYLMERQTRFPGVTVETAYLRQYPHGDLAAQLLGYVGQVNARELKGDPTFRGVSQGTTVGQGGIEYQYDRYLRGRDGADLLRINSLGEYQGFLRRREPVPGHRLQLSLDLGLQSVGQRAILQAGGGKPGAFVALDPKNGELLGMGSLPTFDPSVFVPAITGSQYRALTSPSDGQPLLNRAIQGLYPTGSTFKPITALAALTTGILSLGDVVGDTGCINIGIQQRCNAGRQALGPVNLVSAIRKSSDVFFYLQGERLNDVAHLPLQRWARRLGLGRPTGVDLPGELGGNVPDPAWRAAIAATELKCEKRRHVPSCGISDGRPWSVGDEVSLAIGQGDLLATPLQMAVAYSAIENSGRVVRPHLGLEVQDSAGRVVQTLDQPPVRRVRMNSAFLSAIKEGLHEAASQPDGTSGPVFQGWWPQNRYPVYGKTGTAQHLGQSDQSWYVCFVPDPARPIVVAVTIEGGGFGASAAAPAAAQILARWYGVKPKFQVGSSQTF